MSILLCMKRISSHSVINILLLPNPTTNPALSWRLDRVHPFDYLPWGMGVNVAAGLFLVRGGFTECPVTGARWPGNGFMPGLEHWEHFGEQHFIFDPNFAPF